MKQLVIIIIVLFVLATVGSGFEFNTGSANGSGQALILSSPTPTALLAAASQGLIIGGWRVESGYTRQFDLRDLDQFFLAGAWRFRNISGAVGVSQFGKSELYSEKLAKLAVTFHHHSFSLGGSGSVMALSFGQGYAGLGASTVGMTMGWQRDSLYVSFSADNLTTPRFGTSSPGLRSQYTTYLELKRASWSTLGRITLEKKQKPQFAIGQRVTLRQKSALMWGLSTSPLQFGGGVDLGIESGTIGYTATYHPTLGMTQTITVSYGSSRVTAGRDSDFK